MSVLPAVSDTIEICGCVLKPKPDHNREWYITMHGLQLATRLLEQPLLFILLCWSRRAEFNAVSDKSVLSLPLGLLNLYKKHFRQ